MTIIKHLKMDILSIEKWEGFHDRASEAKGEGREVRDGTKNNLIVPSPCLQLDCESQVKF